VSSHPSRPPASSAVAEEFYSGAIRRILRILAVLAVALLAPIWLVFGLAPALGFAAGAASADPSWWPVFCFAIYWLESLPMLYSKVLITASEAFWLGFACRWLRF